MNALIIIFTILLFSCDDQKETRVSSQKNDLESIEVKVKESEVIQVPKLEFPRIPPQEEFVEHSDKFLSTFAFHSKSNPFDDDITIKFESDSGFIFKNNNYILSDTFLGSFNGFFDNIEWRSPWKIISVNMDTHRVFGGNKAGKGVPIGYVSWDGTSSQLVLQTEYEIIKKERAILVKRPKNIPYVTLETCPNIIKKVKGCHPYVNFYNALASIDFTDLGEIGEDVAKEVISVKTGLKLVQSLWEFDKGIDAIRTQYLVPLLKTINGLQELQHLDKKSEESKLIYSDLIYRIVDSTVKTQLLSPEAIESLGITGLGVLLAYVGAQDLGDSVIAYKQPKWFREIISPVIREIGIAGISLIDHESEESFDTRVQRFIELKEDIRESIKRICHNSENKNECLDALK